MLCRGAELVGNLLAAPWWRAPVGILLQDRHGVALREAESVDQGQGHLKRRVVTVLASDCGRHFVDVGADAGDEVSHEENAKCLRMCCLLVVTVVTVVTG